MTPSTSFDLAELWPVAHAAADAARVQTLKYFRSTELIAESKRTDFDPVTIADRAAESAMREVIQAHRADDGILGEEHASFEGSTGLTWVLDPIDGTRGYISGTPTWGVLIAVSSDDGPILGLVDQPYIGERFCSGPRGATVEGPMGTAEIRVRTGRALNEATLFTTFPEVGSVAQRDAFMRVAEQVKLTRYGCDCYAYALLAAGQIDLVIEAGLEPYDIQAPIALVEAAGGIVTTWDGKPAYNGGTAIAAATPELHEVAMELLAQ